MKFYTLQPRFVMDIVNENKLYEPDFNKSEYLAKDKDLKTLYNFFLQSFNDINLTDQKGLVFTFLGYDNINHASIDNINDMLSFLNFHDNAIHSLMQELLHRENMVWFEIEAPYPFFNAMALDINDFQYIMPPLVEKLDPYTEGDFARILRDIERGRIPDCKLPSGVMQAHLPAIYQKDVLNVYDAN